ncbi:DUF1697 domain-containing protein [Dermatobacter hominis]|uniref:DUF1697 domain-containing protein n=1 Tax=Dermatobacter hominis TaxID=2884263 RepID=UPI001D1062FD|nr:DUF1697 domain-containing protein [Dermatobacter hominis]UDY35722.1 DUF1697 domain-containing protein [Dermatobacter hominis]
MGSPTHVGFLRAVNVGGRTARKEQLVAAAEAAGADDVSTFIASGNLLFAPGTLPVRRPQLETALERALEDELGFTTEVFVRGRRQLAALADCDPWDGAVDLDAGTWNVGFLRAALPAADAARLVSLSSADDHLATSGSELHWHTAGKMSDSVLFQRPKDMGRAIGDVPVTMRNIRTVRRLVDKLG